jgi:vacuolar-type H+-ATPase subunit H
LQPWVRNRKTKAKAKQNEAGKRREIKTRARLLSQDPKESKLEETMREANQPIQGGELSVSTISDKKRTHGG